MDNSELSLIQSKIQNLFRVYVPPLCISKDCEQIFEVSGTKEAIKGRKKVDGYYFGSVVPKPNDIRLYYFPIYTHVKKFCWISDELRKCQKGKSCFHIKKMNASLEAEIARMIKTGIDLYRKEDLI
jgi:hypothetical protein